MITLKLPVPPGVNKLYANVPGKGRVKTAVYRAWIKEAGLELIGQLATRRTGLPITGDVSVSIRFPRLRSDLDAPIKATLDLLTRHQVYNDDRQVAEMRVRFHPDAWMLVEVGAVPEADMIARVA